MKNFGRVLILSIFSLSFAGNLAAQEGIDVIVNDVLAEPTEGEASYTVTSYITITDSIGNPLTDLDADDFTLSQDGTDVDVQSVEIVERPLAVVLVLDTSGSMVGAPMEAVKSAATSFLDSLQDGDQIGVVYFNDEVVIAQNLSDDIQAGKTIVSLLESENLAGTCLYDAAYDGISMASGAPAGRRAVILLTDGQDEVYGGGICSEHIVEDVTDYANDTSTRVPIYTLGIGNGINSNELRSIAEKTGGDDLLAPSNDDIAGLFGTLAEQFKNQYAVTYITETTSGEHTLSVSVDVDGVSAVGTRSFVAPELPPLLVLSGITDGQFLEANTAIRASVTNGSVTSAEFVLDGDTYTVEGSPFELEIDLEAISPGRHTLDVTVTTDDGTTLEDSLSFDVALPEAEEREGASEEPAGSEEEPLVTTTQPKWLLPAGIGGLFVIIVLLVLILRRSGGSSAQVVGASEVGSIEPFTEDAFGVLIVQESLSLREGQRFGLYGDLVKLGRGADNDVIIPDAPVSRNHAEIRKEGDGTYLIYDLGSTYGIFVDDVQFEGDGLQLTDGCTVKLGTRTMLTYTELWQPQVADMDERTMDFVVEDFTVQHGDDDDGATMAAFDAGGPDRIATQQAGPADDGGTIVATDGPPDRVETRQGGEAPDDGGTIVADDSFHEDDTEASDSTKPDSQDEGDNGDTISLY